MERAGMVHALERVHRLLKPAGELIDIHPATEPAAIEIRLGRRVFPAGWLQETDDYVEYELADQALAAVVNSRLFSLERSGAFDFVWHADNLADLRAYLAEEWQDAMIDDVTLMRAEELLQSIELDKEVIVREKIQLARFRRL
jgi:hypothetical protein